MAFDITGTAQTNFDIDISGGAPSGLIPAWLGVWIEKPVKRWSGSVWETKPVKRWNGTIWEET